MNHIFHTIKHTGKKEVKIGNMVMIVMMMMICEAKLENPFITSFSSSQSPANSRPLSKKERLERHQKLIKENPDIENVISYVNKRGEISKRRVLTSKEKKRFKPRALIFKDDDDSGNE